MFKRIAAILSIGTLVVSFQNCSSGVEFESFNKELVAMNNEVFPDVSTPAPTTDNVDEEPVGPRPPLLIEDEDQTQRVEPVTDDPKNENNVPTHQPRPPKMEDEEQTTDTPAEHHDPDGQQCDHNNDSTHNNHHATHEEHEQDNSNEHQQYVCILNGPGKSLRLGLINGILDKNGKTPSTVCLSKLACLEIVSTKFDVIGAEKRGFCDDKNKNITSLSNRDIEILINGL